LSEHLAEINQKICEGHRGLGQTFNPVPESGEKLKVANIHQ